MTGLPHPMTAYRTESDLLGAQEVPAGALYGIHTVRALGNFPLTGRPVHRALVHAFGAVKLACARTNRSLGQSCGPQGHTPRDAAIARACTEMMEGLLDEHIVVDALQGGAGTSLNMNVNEVLANRALQILALPPGNCGGPRADSAAEASANPLVISPHDDINRHQSTNDTYPTALRVAALLLLRDLEREVVALQEAFQQKERQFADVVKVGRTQLQDAALTTLGREMGAYAEAFNRDRWRIYKCQERLRVVNLGGTAIGTGLGAPREYIFRVVDELRAITGLPLARAENLVEATQNADVFVEVSGILKACATNLLKIAGDLRLLASGPEAGLGEIRLPARQAGSSIMPGKVNPVIPEAVSQAAMMVMAHDQAIAHACSAGSLELNPFLPLVADCLLHSLDLLTNACAILRRNCVDGLAADAERCRRHVASSTATLTALVETLGYEAAQDVAHVAQRDGRTVRDVVMERGLLTEQQFDALTSAEAVMRLGGPVGARCAPTGAVRSADGGRFVTDAVQFGAVRDGGAQ